MDSLNRKAASLLELTTTDEWNYVQSCDSPADAGSRGLSAIALPKGIWLKRPAFLETSDWPIRPSEHSSFKCKQWNDTSSEEKPSFGDETVLNANAGISTSTSEWQKYSSYEKLLHVAAYILRFLPKNEAYSSITGAITFASELKIAQMKIFFVTQSECFSTETNNLLKTSPLSSSSIILQFSPFIGPQSLLRATGRTKKLDGSCFDAKHPILHDSHHPLTRLFLENLHRTHCHQGVDYLRAFVQQQFAIVNLRTAVRIIALRCVTCRKCRADTLIPIMPDLP